MSLQARLNAVVRAKTVVQVAEKDDDRRWAQRRASRLPAHLFMANQRAPVHCVLLDGSSTGAQLELTNGRSGIAPSVEMLPDRFLLVIELHKTQVDCAIAWRRGSRLGVRYLGATRPYETPTRAAIKKK
jgi:hypothetical protein